MKTSKSREQGKKSKVISMEKGNDELRFQPYTLKSGDTILSIRAFYEDKHGEMQPGKQGLTLKMEEVSEFVSCLKELFTCMKSKEDE